MSKPPRWTPKDLEDLRELCSRRKNRRLNWPKIRERFPDRTTESIYKQMHLRGMCQSVAWSQKEDEVLIKCWGSSGIASLKKRLPGRSRVGIYGRAQKLGLSAGTPQGMVSVKSLSDDPAWGYDYYKTLRILSEGGARVRSFSYAGKKRGVRYVDIDEARAAAENWERRIAEQRVGRETPKEAALRLRLREHTLRGWLTQESLMPKKEPGRKYKFWALPEVYDRLFAKYKLPPRI